MNLYLPTTFISLLSNFNWYLLRLLEKNATCDCLFDMLAMFLNLVGNSPKRKENISQKQAERAVDALASGELKYGFGLNQKLGSKILGDTHWRSYFRLKGQINLLCFSDKSN